MILQIKSEIVFLGGESNFAQIVVRCINKIQKAYTIYLEKGQQ